MRFAKPEHAYPASTINAGRHGVCQSPLGHLTVTFAISMSRPVRTDAWPDSGRPVGEARTANRERRIPLTEWQVADGRACANDPVSRQAAALDRVAARPARPRLTTQPAPDPKPGCGLYERKASRIRLRAAHLLIWQVALFITVGLLVIAAGALPGQAAGGLPPSCTNLDLS